MKKLFLLFIVISLSFCSTFAWADHFVFGGIVIDRSQVMVILSSSGEESGHKIEAEATIGSGMTAQTYGAQCEDKALVKTVNEALPSIAKHLNTSKDTNLIDTLTEAGLTGCQYIKEDLW